MPITHLVRIKEEACIGCVKCIEVCPVDAILGSEQQIHTVIQNQCIGCDLCIPACPVDCIEPTPLPHTYQPPTKTATATRSAARKKRLEAKANTMTPLHSPLIERKAYLKALLSKLNNK